MSDFNGLCYFENCGNIVDLNCNHALQAMVLQLPADGAAWTPEQRANWMRAFDAVLDFAHPDSVKPRQESIDEIIDRVSRSFGPPALKLSPADPQSPLADLIEKAGFHPDQETPMVERAVSDERGFQYVGHYVTIRDAAKSIKRAIRKGNGPGLVILRKTDGRYRVCAKGYVMEPDEIEVGTYDKGVPLNDLCGDLEAAAVA